MFIDLTQDSDPEDRPRVSLLKCLLSRVTGRIFGHLPNYRSNSTTFIIFLFFYIFYIFSILFP